MQVSILLGYPLVAMWEAFVGGEGSFAAIVYRTIVCAAALGLIAVSLSDRAAGRLPKMLWFFLAVYTIRLLYDWLYADIIRADFSLLFFAGTTLLPVAALHLSAIKGTSDQRLSKFVLGFGFLFLALALVAQVLGLGGDAFAVSGADSIRFGTEKLNPISIGSAAGTIGLAALFMLSEPKSAGLVRWKQLAALVVVLAAYIMLLGNSRGPIIGVVMAVLWFASTRIRRLVFLLPVGLLVVGILSTDVNLADKVYGRFTVDYLSDGAVVERLISQRAAIDAFFEHPFLGAYYLDPALGVGFYPHNIFIEAAMALGLFGLALLVIVTWRSILAIWKGFGAAHRLYTMLFIQYGVLSLTSGNLWSGDAFFYLLGLPLILRQRGGKRTGQAALPQMQIAPAFR